jgi:hypothetical protein
VVRPPYDEAIGVTVYADNTFDVPYKPVAEQGSIVYSGAWPLSSIPEPSCTAAVYTLLDYYFDHYFANVYFKIGP